MAAAFAAVLLLVLGPLAPLAQARFGSGKEQASTSVAAKKKPSAKRSPGAGKAARAKPSAGKQAATAKPAEKKSKHAARDKAVKASPPSKAKPAKPLAAKTPKPVAAKPAKSAKGKAPTPSGVRAAASATSEPAKAKRANPPLSKAAKSKRPLVLIDPGHGGQDPGAMAGGLVEKHVTLKVARLLRAQLERKGFAVKLTRSTDKAMTPAARLRMASRLRPVLFVSLHCNWSASGREKGIETFAYLPKRLHSGRGSVVPLEDAPAATVSADHAGELHHELARALGARGVTDNGARLGRFAVLTPRPWPSILIEMGYLSNKSDAKRLASANFQSWFAARLADAVADRFAPGASLLAGREPAPRS